MDLEKSLVNLHGRLHSMQGEFQSDLASLISELEGALSAAEQLGSMAATRDKHVRRLEARTEGQNNIIQTLSEEVGESHHLRTTVRERDLEIARLTRELQSKNELIRALRLQLDTARSSFADSEVETG